MYELARDEETSKAHKANCQKAAQCSSNGVATSAVVTSGSQRSASPAAAAPPAPVDWGRANGWKIPSLAWGSLAAGLRPVEVKRAVTSWVDVDNALLRMSKEHSAKYQNN